MDYIFNGILHAFGLLFSGNPETYSAIRVTLAVSTLSIACSMCIGIPMGFALGYFNFPGQKVCKTIVDTLLSLPTVVIGLLVYAMLSRSGPMGGLGLLFTIPGIAVGQIILALPIIIALTANAVENQDKRLRQTLLTMGATPRQLLLSSLWEARYSLALAGVAAYGRIVSEIGISMMVGGNIKWHTRTITTAIALETGKGQFAMGIALGLVLMCIALAVNLALVGLKKRAQ